MGDMASENTGETLGFGKHKDLPWTRVPVGYLKWMLTEATMRADRRQKAAAELARRGTATPDLDVSGHAIDRASLKCRKTWHETRSENEGLHSWLCRVAREALDKGERDDQGRYLHLGMKFAFEEEGSWPVLKTVMPAKKRAG